MQERDLGKVVTTKAVFDLEVKSLEFALFVSECFKRYLRNDWGELTDDDKKMNDQAVRSTEYRIHASYPFPPNAPWNATNSYGGNDDKLWIITEWDRSVTTALFPSDY